MVSSLFQRRPSEPKQSVTELKNLPPYQFNACTQVGKKTIMIGATDARGSDYAKRLLVYSDNEVKTEIQLSKYCTQIRPCGPDLLLCGAEGHILVIDLTLGKEVSQWPPSGSKRSNDSEFELVHLYRSCVVPRDDGFALIIGNFMSNKRALHEFYCDSRGNLAYERRSSYSEDVSDVCASLTHPRDIVIYEGQAAHLHSFLDSTKSYDRRLIASGILPRIPYGSHPRLSDVRIKALPTGGYLFRDADHHYILVNDIRGTTLANWCRSDSPHMPLNAEKLQITDLHVLSDGETFLVNFGNGDDLSKIGVFRMPSEPVSGCYVPPLQLTVQDIGVQIRQMAVDEEQRRVIILTEQGEIRALPQFAPVVEAVARVQTARSNIQDTLNACGLTEPLSKVVYQYYRKM